MADRISAQVQLSLTENSQVNGLRWSDLRLTGN